MVSVKCLKEELIGLLNFKYFNGLSPPFTKYLDLLTSTRHSSKLLLLYTLTLQIPETVLMNLLVNLRCVLSTDEVSCVPEQPSTPLLLLDATRLLCLPLRTGSRAFWKLLGRTQQTAGTRSFQMDPRHINVQRPRRGGGLPL